MAVRGYRVHGLELVSEIPLPDQVAADVDPATAIHVRVVERRSIPAEVPGDAAAVTYLGDTVLSFIERTASGWELCYPEFLSFAISGDLRCVEAVLAPNTADEYLSIMLGGAVSSLIATLQNDLVLHASAVERNGKLVVLAGPSGSGKSTTATLLAAAGLPSFADDVLRVELTSPPKAHRGIAESRLRPGSVSLRARFSGGNAHRETIDGRLAVSLEPASSNRLPVGMVVLPWPDHNARDVNVELLSSLEAFKSLHACLRTSGWREVSFVEQAFEQVSILASSVPVLQVAVPWGPPFADDAGERLLAAIDAAG